ncbi:MULTISPECIES: hypothetical protein [unclassified Streptomyces]|uniref:hypothetical protein n=1 Tax=unclassified Streptomyces TaxID=2593676 RepID=UPI00278BD699|nr:MULTISPECIES: hypothetical protein [unclassified Streptomyces]
MTTRTSPSAPALARTQLARAQDQLLTREQLLALGCADSTISYRTRRDGPWQRILRHVYLLQTGPPTPRQRLRAALLYGGEHALLTGHAALTLHNFRAAPRPERLRYVDVLVPYEGADAARRASGYVRVHRTRRVPEVWPVAGLRCAEPGRAVADAVRDLACERDVTALLAEAVQQGFCAPEALLSELRASRRHLAPYVARSADHLTAGVHSALEADARALLHRYGLPEPLWNPDLHDPSTGTFLARPDAYWPAHGVALEVDSRAYHFDVESWQRTLAQRNRLARAGLRVVAVTGEDLRARPGTVADHIRATLTSCLGAPVPALLLNNSPSTRGSRAASARGGGAGRRPEGRAGRRPRGGGRRG